MTTTELARRPTCAVAEPVTDTAEPQVKAVMPLSIGLAGTAGVVGLLAVWSWLYAGRTGQAQVLGGVVALLLLAAFYERIRERR
jgi:hypothetical protein